MSKLKSSFVVREAFGDVAVGTDVRFFVVREAFGEVAVGPDVCLRNPFLDSCFVVPLTTISMFASIGKSGTSAARTSSASCTGA